MPLARLEWDATKDRKNQAKHGVAFTMAQLALPIRGASLQRIFRTVAPKDGTSVLVG